MTSISNDLDLPRWITDPLLRLRGNIFTDAVVAGGALRDLDNGREVKDVDIFMWSQGLREGDMVARLALLFPGWHVHVQVPSSACDYCRMENVDYVVNLGAPEGWPPIQVIAMTEPRGIGEILARHDFGLCSIATDGLEIYRTYQYIRDREDKAFTLTRCRDVQDFFRSHRRFLKWAKGKYQGWSLRIPECFNDLNLGRYLV